jgi:hypothetical protein
MDPNDFATYGVFISYMLSRLDKLFDYLDEKSKRDDFVKSTVKEALLGCYFDWRKPNKYAIEQSDAKLRRYAELLNTVNARFRANNLLSSKLSECLLGLSYEMMDIAEKPKGSGILNSYTEETDRLFAKLNSIYENFDSLYESYGNDY